MLSSALPKGASGDTRTGNLEAHDSFLRGRKLLLGSNKNREIFDRIVTVPGVRASWSRLRAALCRPWHGLLPRLPRAIGLTFLTDSISPRTSLLRRSKGPQRTLCALCCSGRRNVEKEPREGESRDGTRLKLNPNYACLRHPQPRRSLSGSSAAAIPFIERAIRSAYVSADQYEALHFASEFASHPTPICRAPSLPRHWAILVKSTKPAVSGTNSWR